MAESITYVPIGASPVTINASVVRHPVEPHPETSGLFVKRVEVSIANDAVKGVSAVTLRGDKVTLPYPVGGQLLTFLVRDRLSQDWGIWHLLCEQVS